MPYQFQGKQDPEAKLFVCICHEAAHAICMKATSQVVIYENNKEAMAGAVYYRAGELSFFPQNTVIQPDNQFPIPHTHLNTCHNSGTFAVLGRMPDDFRQRLIDAVKASVTMTSVRKQHILERI